MDLVIHMPNPLHAFKLEPQFRDYVWGGTHLRPGQQTAEVWVVHENNKIASGSYSGKTLADISAEFGADLLGIKTIERTGVRFPILIKLLDCAQWLSLQVHPDNEQAIDLEGPGQFGKTEAWYILHADPGAEILCGFQPGVEPEDISTSVREGFILDYIQRLRMNTGDTVFIKAGTVHALGPGLLVYEVQQTSDITYRVFDWNRPASAGRELHIEQSLAVLDLYASATPLPEPPLTDGQPETLVRCPFFKMDLIHINSTTAALDTAGVSFHSLTVIDGNVSVTGDDWEIRLSQYETILVPANQGTYSIYPNCPSKILKASAE